MKYFLTTILLFLTLNNANAWWFSKDKVVDYLQERNGVFYETNIEEPFTGKLIEKYNNGQKKAEGNYKNGKQDGLTTFWRENGQKETEQNYKNGKQDGLSTWWYKNGQKEAEINYKNGKPQR